MADKPLNYNELLKKAEEKRNTKILAGQKIKEECDLSKIITVDSSKELALLTHYNSFPEVEVESNINDFWNSQQSKLKSIEQKMVQPSDKYVNLVEKLLAIRENRDSRISSSKGTNNFNEQRKEALESLKKAKEQQEKVMNDDKANPFEIMFQLIGLNNEKFEERDKQIRDAIKGVKDAKKRLKSIDEQKANFKEAINKLNVDEQMVFVDMNDCLLEITELKEEAKLVNSNSEVAHNRLSNQYEIIDKLTAIQTLKKSGTYQTIRTLLSSTNPSLLTELDNIPDSLPDDTFKISLSNPLTLSTIQIDTDKISEIDQKISEIGQKITETENKLPNGININNLDSKINDLSTDKNNLSTEIANFELKDSDTITIQDLENSMSNIQDHTSKQYKTLEMKRDHLVLKEKVKVAESDVQNLKDEIVENGDSQDTLKNLKEKQDYLKILQEKLQNDSYSKTLSNLKESYSKTNSDLEELQKFQKELQKLQRESQTLQSEKKYFEAPRNLANIDSITQQLENSNIPRGNMTISNIFKSILQNIEEKKENLPIKPQPTRSGPTRSSGSGR